MTGIVLAYDKSILATEDSELLVKVAPQVAMVKIGLESLTAITLGGVSIGYTAHELVVRSGGRGFQDWKIHDIATTMERAVANLTNMTSVITLHGAASIQALDKAVVARNNRTLGALDPTTLLLGVTVLTDIDTEQCVSIFGEHRPEKVCWLADRLLKVGLDGLVCSGLELEELAKRGILKDAKTLVAGTRPSWAPVDDQKNVVSYERVAELGATWTVVGRVAMKAPDPLETLTRVKTELGSA